jgi:acyl-CoA thioesterase-1
MFAPMHGRMARSRILIIVTSLGLAWLGATAPRAADRPTAPGSAASPAAAMRPAIVILGDSLAAGHGVEPAEAFPALLQRKVDEAGWPYEVVNAGVSGDTTAGGRRRLAWLLRRPMDVLVVELGGNDGLRGLPPSATRSNLVAIIDAVRSRVPGVQVVLAGMQMPPNMGLDYAREYREIFPAVARDKEVLLIPHLLEGVGGKPEMNLPDQIHPTPAGHAVLADNVWRVLRPLLERRMAR